MERAVPILPSRDLAETRGFFDRLGFEVTGDYPEQGYLIVTRGSLELHFFSMPDVDPLTTDFSCYLHVDDADALHREWADAGIPFDPATGSRLTPPADTFYDKREFALVDPSGNLYRVGS